MIHLILHEIKSRRMVIFAWGVGLTIFGTIYLSLAPELFEQLKIMKNLSVYRLVGLHLETVEGYIASVILAYISFLLGIYSILVSTSTLAGEEDEGTLELLVALPLERWQILASKAIALSLVLLFILTIAGIGNAAALAAMSMRYPIQIAPHSLFLALVGALPLLIGFLMMGLFLGSFMPNRRIAAITMSIYFVLGYFGQHLAHISESMKPIQYLSLFHYYDTTGTIFTGGMALTDVLTLLGVAAIFFIFALFLFSRRNITVGTWLVFLGVPFMKKIKWTASIKMSE